MRQIVLDTETTGLDYKKGHRIIEIGCVELINRKVTQRRYHVYLNPEFEIDAAAQAVHGLSNEYLADKPKFAEAASEFTDFIQDAELLIHNAEFDRGFLDNEFALLGKPPLADLTAGIIDTLKLAREMRPGRRNSLDVLCKEFDVDNSGRQLHGALLDAELLAEVYLAMTRGQDTLLMDLDDAPAIATPQTTDTTALPRIVLRATETELAEHERVLAEIAKESKGKCLWLAESQS
ncbi:DNA polymerase III subunit epsilon [Sterolibacterium denitrificans]|uniref:DNA polymerase III subunit epsilon n=1 Tax=Sterolibacterium denitrificans TaxID=157592 RepID=UPI0012B68283|nr:DNA polymerase III subunit epsilon [Sterolibacterium denitrificans]